MPAKGSVYPRMLLPIQPTDTESEWGVIDGSAFIEWKWTVDTAASVTTQYLFNANAPSHGRVLNGRVTLMGAGAASDTVVVQKISGGTTTDITDTIDLSVHSDTDVIDFSQINDANCDFQPGDSIIVTTASDALVRVELDLAWRT